MCVPRRMGMCGNFTEVVYDQMKYFFLDRAKDVPWMHPMHWQLYFFLFLHWKYQSNRVVFQEKL